MEAHCPKCDRLLSVLSREAAKPIYCPACRDSYEPVQNVDQDEDTILQWITQDVRQIDAMRKRHQSLVDQED